MAQPIILGTTVTSSSYVLLARGELEEASLKWGCIRTFVCIAAAYGSNTYNFCMFVVNFNETNVIMFIFVSLILGMPYMYIQFFIKQYTGKVTFCAKLNPLLKPLNYGIMAATLVWASVISQDLLHTFEYMFSSIMRIPPFIDCQKRDLPRCISSKTIFPLCQRIQNKIPLNVTSVEYFFKRHFETANDSSVYTTALFMSAILWLINFFLCSLSENMMTKVFKIAYLYCVMSTVVTVTHITLWEFDLAKKAFADIIKFSIGDINYMYFVMGVYYNVIAFGVGSVGVYGYGNVSPYMMIDTGVVVYNAQFVILAILRSIYIKVMYYSIESCVYLAPKSPYLYTLHVIVPLAANMWKGTRFFLLYTYTYLSITSLLYILSNTYTMSKMLHSQFKRIKLLYISGIISFAGYMITIGILSIDMKYTGAIMKGIGNCMLLLSFLRTTIILYLYGLHRFICDIKFWLGDNPAFYWRVAWAVLPVVIFVPVLPHWLSLSSSTIGTSTVKERYNLIADGIYFFFPLAVAVIAAKVIGKHVADDNFFGIFKPDIRYGPSSAEDRKRRRKYDEAVSKHHCTHKCNQVDDKFTCDHEQKLLDQPTTELGERPSSLQGMTAHTLSMMRLFSSPSSEKRPSQVVDMYQN